MSAPFTAGDVLNWVQGARAVAGAEKRAAEFRGAGIDTRENLAGRLFVAIKGPRHDAHEFLPQALAKGAAGLLVAEAAAARAPADAGVPVFAAADTTRALGELAAGHRRQFHGPVVAITGSNGKTTVKEMCAAILSQSRRAHKSRGNWNNAFGLPLSLLSRAPQHEALVLELGMNHPGEIAPLAEMAAPTVGLVTNIGSAHIENLGSREGIAREKGMLLEALCAEHTAVVRGDESLCAALAKRTRARCVTFGARCDVCAENVRDLRGRFAFRLLAPEGQTDVEVAGLGAPTVVNALGAAAAALAAGAPLSTIGEGLAAYQPAPGRMNPLRGPGGLHVIDDSYNANPQSMAAALEALARMAQAEGEGARSCAVLGAMGERGAAVREEHAALGRQAAQLKLDALVALGEYAGDVLRGASAAGMQAAQLRAVQSHEQAAAAARNFVATQGASGAGKGQAGWVLVKGSRAAQMELCVRALTGGAA